MRGREGLVLAVSAALMAACATTPAKPTYGPEAPSKQNPPNTLVVPPPTATIDPATLLLLTPQVRADAMIATAQVAETKGPDGLIKEGFPPEAIASQRVLESQYNITFLFNNQEYDIPQGARMDATLVSLDGTPYSDYILIATAGHVFDPATVDRTVVKDIHDFLGQGDITFEKTKVILVSLGDDIVLKSDQFSYIHQYDNSNEANFKDFGFLVVPKKNIPQEVLEKTMKDAIPFDRISFTPANTDEKYYGICTPGATNFKSVPAEGAKYMGDNGRGIMIGPWLTGGGCSGAGTFTKDTDGQVYLKGINVGDYYDQPGYNTFATTFPYGSIGKDYLFQAIQAAEVELKSLTNTP
jgi:hypothetical protein